jgi:hypothetical protein
MSINRMVDTNAGAAYNQLIADQLWEERSRKSSLEARGLAVITTSGTLATLLFALTAGLTTAAHFKLPGHARLPLVLALVAFVLAALLGLITNIPLQYKEPSPDGLAVLVDANYWSASAEIGQIRVAQARVSTLAAARSANAQKVTLLLGAMFFELLAVGFLTWAIIAILYV